MVTLSATRAIGGTNTIVSERIAFTMPAPSAPEIAIASSTEGKAKNTSTVRMIAVLTRPPTKPATMPSEVPIDEGEEHRRDADEQRQPPAIDQPREHVAAELVGAERIARACRYGAAGG